MKNLVKYLLISSTILLLASCGRSISIEESTKTYNNLLSSHYGIFSDELKKFASVGVIDAQVRLSLHYGSKNNKKGELHWLRKAAEQGHVPSQLNLGWIYEDGQGVEKNAKESFKWFEKAANQDNAQAQNWLGYMYDNGKGVEQDYEKAVDWYRKAADQGNAAAKNNLGNLYYSGKGVEQDYDQAFNWFKKAANQDNAQAQNGIGLMYTHGKGTKQDYKQAIKWYKRAAEQGHVAAKKNIKIVQIKNAEQGDANDKFNLYMAYKTGQGIDGIDKDLYKAKHWLREAAEHGNSEAQYLRGIKIQYYNCPDDVFLCAPKFSAITWYLKAAEQGHSNAQNNLASWYYTGWDEPFSGLKKSDTLDFKQAFKWYMASEPITKDVQAQERLGAMHHSGNGVAQNHEQALNWYTKAAEQGSEIAKSKIKPVQIAIVEKNTEQGSANDKFNLYTAYKTGQGIDGIDKDLYKAKYWLRKAAKQGHATAQNKLGDMHYHFKDYKEAFKWYTEAAEQGYATAQNKLGGMYYYGTGTTQDYKEAFKWYTKVSNQGDANIQNNLGTMHYAGKGVDQDYNQAFNWFEKAANQDNAQAQNSLGYMYDSGKGVEQSYDQAFMWFKKSANQDDAMAQSNLAEKYEKGQGAKQDYKQAVKWYQKSASQEDAKAKLSLKSLEKKITNADTQNAIAWMYSNGKDIAKDDKKAFMWHQKAANQDHANSQNSLGYMYDSGKGVEQDYDQAFNWFKKAANQDNANAQNNMGIMYEHGQGVKKSYLMAAEYYRLSAKNGHEKGIEMANSVLLDSIDLGPISKKMTDELYMTKTYDHSVQHKDVKNLSQRVQVYMVGLTGIFGADKYFSYTMQLNESGQIVDTKLLTDSWTYNTLLPPGDGKDMAEFIGEVLWEGGKMYIDVQSSYINDDSASVIYFKAFPWNEYKGYTITKDSITKTVKFYGVNDDGKSEWVIMEFESMKSLINHNSCELSKFVVNSNAGGWLEVRPFEGSCEFNKMLTN